MSCLQVELPKGMFYKWGNRACGTGKERIFSESWERNLLALEQVKENDITQFQQYSSSVGSLLWASVCFPSMPLWVRTAGILSDISVPRVSKGIHMLKVNATMQSCCVGWHFLNGMEFFVFLGFFV